MSKMRENVLLDNILLVTPTPENDVLVINNAYLTVKDGIIAYAGSDRSEAVNSLASSEYQVYSGRGRLVWPSMANTHGHIPMTLLRNQTDDHNLHDWLFNVVFPREARLTSGHVYSGSQLGIAEMIRNGTGAAADMYYFSDSVAQAAADAGFRLNVCCDGKEPGVDQNQHVAGNILSDFNSRWQAESDLIRTSLLVHSIYLYEPYLYEELASAAKEHQMFVQVHVSETAKEVSDCIEKYGCRPAEQLARFGIFDRPSIAAHCVFLDDNDRRLLAEKNVYVAHNPSSNFKLGSGFADVTSMMAAGIRISLGTDGAASNNNLNLYQEMRLAAFLAKGLTRDASVLPARELIKMATVNGMQALGFDKTGCLQPGWTADLQILDIDRPSMYPLGDPVAAIVYSSDNSCVESLMTNGSWLMYKNELKTIDEEKVMAEASVWSRDLSDL